MNKGKKFDIVLMNPPYSGINVGDSIYINFINKCIKIGKKIITISPLTGFLGHNEHGSAAGKNVELHNLMDEYKPEIEEVKNIFDAGIKGKVGISFFNTENVPEKIRIKYLSGSIIETDKQLNIIDNDNKYLKEFKSHIYKYMIGEDTDEFINLKYPYIYKGKDKTNEIKFVHDKLFNHLNCVKNIEGLSIYKNIKEDNYDKDKLYIFLFKLNASFGEYLYKQTNNNAIKYDINNKIFNQSGVMYIKLNKNEYEKSKNICSYLKTDFCKLLLRLRGRYYHSYLKFDFVPWLDFSKEWTDEELFKMIGMKYDKEEIYKILNN